MVGRPFGVQGMGPGGQALFASQSFRLSRSGQRRSAACHQIYRRRSWTFFSDNDFLPAGRPVLQNSGRTTTKGQHHDFLAPLICPVAPETTKGLASTWSF